MPDYVEVPGAHDLKNGEMKMFSIGGHEILVANVDNRFYASDNRCTHAGGDLSSGKLEKTIVTCPRHHSQFDLSDGRVVRWTDWTGVKLSIVKAAKPPRSIKTYKVNVEGDKVWIDL